MIEVKLINSYRRIIVDDEDYERVSLWNWSLQKSRTGICIYGWTGFKQVNLASYIMGQVDKMYDHKDRNPFNNQKFNLRHCTQSQNMANIPKRRLIKASSNYKGVNSCSQTDLWRARINSKHIGYYPSEVEAAKAYNIAAKKLYGEFACLNKI